MQSDGKGLTEVELYDLKVYAPTSLLLERQNRFNKVQKIAIPVKERPHKNIKRDFKSSVDNIAHMDF